jgi:predicted chitinase
LSAAKPGDGGHIKEATVDVATMLKVFPGLGPARAKELNSGLNKALRLAGCTTVKRAAMFCAQVGEESISLTAPTELGTGAEYQGRVDLGNTQPGDGVRFKGRSFIQVTGRSHYGEFSRWAHGKGLAPNKTYFVDHPAQLATDKYVWLGTVWYWTVARHMNSFADAGDIHGATLAVNGGLNGYDERKRRYHLCLRLGNAILPTSAILEDSMLLNKGQDAITPIALPNDIKVVRFYSDQPAQLAVDTREKDKPVIKLNLNKANAPVVQVPGNIHAFVAHRLDAGTNDISVAFGA